MHKIIKISFASLIIFLFIFPLFAEEESFTITTYYPSPYGSYNQLEVYRSVTYKPVDKETLSDPREGELVYDINKESLYFYNGSKWMITGIPSGMIAMFDTSCPEGWTRFTALDNKYPKGAAAYGATGGSDAHGHTATISPHSKNYGCPGGGSFAVPGGGSGCSCNCYFLAEHSNSISTASNEPPYAAVVWCKKD